MLSIEGITSTPGSKHYHVLSSFKLSEPRVPGGRIERKVFLARCCLGQVPGGAPFSQRSEQATACTNRMQIRN